jgi:uncharacterized membrane protein YkvA (DUF1232 family)
MTPSTKLKVLAVAVLLYLIWPYDLIPDRFPRGFGYIDDLALIAWLFLKRQGLRRAAQPTTEPASAHTDPPFDPYEVFELPRTATAEEIDARYKVLVSQYHPDKVHHLGPDLQRVAHDKMLAIQRAYAILKPSGQP